MTTIFKTTYLNQHRNTGVLNGFTPLVREDRIKTVYGGYIKLQLQISHLSRFKNIVVVEHCMCVHVWLIFVIYYVVWEKYTGQLNCFIAQQWLQCFCSCIAGFIHWSTMTWHCLWACMKISAKLLIQQTTTSCMTNMSYFKSVWLLNIMLMFYYANCHRQLM